MRIVDFMPRHLEQAVAMAQKAYERQRMITPSLPIADLSAVDWAFAGNGLGVAAVEEEHLVGFLCAEGPFGNAFRSTDAVGMFSPMHGNAAEGERRAAIYGRMYQAAGEKWVRAGASSHAICLYAGDEAAQRQFFRTGFGMRCADGMRSMGRVMGGQAGALECLELQGEERLLVYPLEAALEEHVAASPTFLRRPSPTPEDFRRRIGEERERYFVARLEGSIAAHLIVGTEGETVVSNLPDMRHITGAYCLPDLRGRGIFPALLQFVIQTLSEEGITRFGVDFETMNPAADAFWHKHFEIYTYGLVRRIDEHALPAATSR